MGSEDFAVHKCHGGGIVVSAFASELHKAVVAADIQFGNVNDYFLSELIGLVKVVGINRQVKGCRAVVYDYRFVYIACLVARNHAAPDNGMLAGIVQTDSLHVIAVGGPVGGLEVENRRIGLDSGGGYHHRRTHEIVAARSQRCCAHHSACYV